jgi:hypothetical protein
LICNIHSNLMEHRYGHNWPATQSKFEGCVESLENFIRTLYSPINYFLDKRKRKVKIRIDDHDIWSMDETLAHIIVPMLKKLKENKHGSPYVDLSDVPEHLVPSDKMEYGIDSTHHERWEWVMNEMIWAFEQKLIDWEDQYYGEWVQDDSELFGGHHVDTDYDGLKEHQKRMVNGFLLFGKYYSALWD